MSNRNEFELDSGRSIRLVAIDQWATYSGLLEGVPTREMNARIINRAMEGARKRWHFEPYLIQPTETPIDIERDDPFGTPASIPMITCTAKFDCFETANDAGMDGSTLPIVWFQSEFAFPIAETILAHIRSLDWVRYSSDYEY